MPDRIKVYSTQAKETFELWCRERSGVRVWLDPKATPDEPYRGACFTSNLRHDGSPTSSFWGPRKSELVTDIKRFRFAKSLREVKRVQLPCESTGQGMRVRLKDEAIGAMNDELRAVGHEATYRFDYVMGEFVIEVPEWEEESCLT